MARPGATDPVDRALRLDTTVMLVDDPVKRVDNMTMAHGLEARVPFLDNELVDWALRMPPSLKFRRGEGKLVLKDAMRGLLPEEVIRRRKSHEFEDYVVLFDRECHLLSIRFPLMGDDGVPYGICTQSTDITARKLAEHQLKLAARVFDRSSEGIVVTDAAQKILTVNAAFTTVTGYTADEAIGQTPRLLNSGRQNDAFYEDMWDKLQQHGWWQGEIWNRRKSGEVYPEWLTINVVRDNHGNIINYLGIFSDITIVKDSQRRVEFLATHDELTSLPNRTLFLDRIQQIGEVGAHQRVDRGPPVAQQLERVLPNRLEEPEARLAMYIDAVDEVVVDE